ncbi:MAG: hypothetical protein P4M12_09410 [Gammaproteobacteria bacterium]|nr:hypothetical protein [Gammaproteobacteria bacterium]
MLSRALRSASLSSGLQHQHSNLSNIKTELALENKEEETLEPSLILSFMEFQTGLIELSKQIDSERISPKQALQKILSLPKILNKSDTDATGLFIEWPHELGNRIINIVIEKIDDSTNDVHILKLILKKVFITIKLRVNHEMIVEYDLSDKKDKNLRWKKEDIYELVNEFYSIIKVRKIIYKDIYANTQESIVKKNRNWHFNQAQFNQIITQYKMNSITYRINNVIINNAQRKLDDYKFFLNWPIKDDAVVSLKIVFSQADKFYLPKGDNAGYSWFFTERQLLSSFADYKQYPINPGQYYYSLKVYEKADKRTKEKDKEVLNVWLSNDAKYGELHSVHKGKSLSGNDVLNIHKYFDQLFQIKNTFICDDSHIKLDKKSIKIPLRLILALVTGKTWYQTKLPGVKLFECKNFKSAHDGLITQNQDNRNLALLELQNLTLEKLYTMLGGAEQKSLVALYKNYIPHPQILHRATRGFLFFLTGDQTLLGVKTTLRELVTEIYEQSKADKSKLSDLECITHILCKDSGLGGEDIKPMEEDSLGYWYKVRVNELLWNSFFWIKTEAPQARTIIH